MQTQTGRGVPMAMRLKLELWGPGRVSAAFLPVLASALASVLVGTAGCHQTLGAGGKCGTPDARASTDVSDSSAGAASNDPGCPATWSEIIPGGYPAICTSNGLICTYPQGQAECAPDGTVSKWATSGATPGCSETAPALGAACGSPGLSCQYITGTPDVAFTTSYCCDGTRCAWALEGGNGCPNGNSCGAISTSDYDQSCTADADCVEEPAGDFCQQNKCTNCIGGAISTKAQAQYEADLASKITRSSLCPCPFPGPATCDRGKCVVGAVGAATAVTSGN
jgi:hypothetical protein